MPISELGALEGAAMQANLFMLAAVCSRVFTKSNGWNRHVEQVALMVAEENVTAMSVNGRDGLDIMAYGRQ